MSFRERIVTLLLPLLTSTIAVASEAPPKELADANGCKFVLPAAARPGTELKWDGACVDGYLSGPGTADLGFIMYKGEFKRGELPNGEAAYANGGPKYTGEMVGNKAQGRGEMQLPDGPTIRGLFKDHRTIIGIAELSWADGSKYTGEVTGLFVMDGKGKIVYGDGRAYEGGFLQNKFHGQGKYAEPAGDSYEGEFAHGKYQGQGTLVFSNAARYVGQFANGHRQGKGRLVHPDQTIEEGEWKAGRLDGECHIKYSVGSEYTGHCLNGQLSGPGKFTDATNGSSYEGAFLAGKYHGQGRLSGAGYVYEGEFVGGVKSGKGKEAYEAGEQYEGTFARDLREGTGVIKATTPAGVPMTYDGAFKNGLLHGPGKMTIGEASFDGEFKQGVFSKGRVHGKDGRVLEIDIEQDSVLEVRADGTKVPIDPESLDPEALKL